MKKLFNQFKTLFLTSLVFVSLVVASVGNAALAAFFNPNYPAQKPYILMAEDIFYKKMYDDSDEIIISLKTAGNICKSVIIPETMNIDGKDYKVAGIGSEAFADCVWLEEVCIPKTVRYIGTYAFGDCYGLKKVKIDGSLQAIGKAAFYSCRNLEKVYIAGNVIEFSTEAFCSCERLKDIFYFGDVKPFFCEDTFDGTNTDLKVHVTLNYTYDNFCDLKITNEEEKESYDYEEEKELYNYDEEDKELYNYDEEDKNTMSDDEEKGENDKNNWAHFCVQAYNELNNDASSEENDSYSSETSSGDDIVALDRPITGHFVE